MVHSFTEIEKGMGVLKGISREGIDIIIKGLEEADKGLFQRAKEYVVGNLESGYLRWWWPKQDDPYAVCSSAILGFVDKGEKGHEAIKSVLAGYDSRIAGHFILAPQPNGF